MTAAADTPGWDESTSSSSRGKMLKPPVTIMSFLRSTIVREPFLVGAGHVAGVQPAELECLRGLLRLVEVLLHHQGAADADLAGLAVGHGLAVLVEERHVEPGHRSSAGGESLRVTDRVLLLAQHRDGHRAFGLTVELEKDRPEAGDALFQPARRHGGGPVVQHLQAGQVSAGQLGVVQQHVDHRRDQHGGRDAVTLDGVEDPLGVEVGQHDQGSAWSRVGTKKAAPAWLSGVQHRKRVSVGHCHSDI